MKKSRLLFALVIGAFGTLSLTSCEQTVSSIDSISVTAPEEELVVGQTIDLKDYIKGVVGEDSYNINFRIDNKTQSTASIEGTKLTVKAEGSIRILVEFDGKTASFKATAISEAKKKFKDLTQNVTSNYYVDNLQRNGKSLTELEKSNSELKLANKGFLHNSFYFATCEDEQIILNGTNNWIGLLRTMNGYSYNFEMSDLQGADFEVMPGVQMDISGYYQSYNFPILYNYVKNNSIFKTVTKDDGTSYLITEQSDYADVWLTCAYGGVFGTFSNYGISKGALKLEFKDVVKANNEKTEALVVSTLVYGNIEGTTYTAENPYVLTKGAVLFDNEFTSVKPVNEYIDAGEKPDQIKAKELEVAVNKFKKSGIYTLETELYWTQYDKTTKKEEKLSSTPSSLTSSFAKSCATSKMTGYITKDGFFYEMSSSEKLGIVKHNDKYYIVSNADSSGSISNTISATTTTENIWRINSNKYSIKNIGEDEYIKNLNVASKTSSEGKTIFEVDYPTSNGFFSANAEAVLDGGTTYKLFAQSSSSSIEMFVATQCEVTVTDTEVVIDIYYSYNSTYTYHIVNTFKDLGVDKLTSKLAGITFPEN